VYRRRLETGEPFAGLASLFLLGLSLDVGEADAALGSIGREPLEQAGLLEEVDGVVRATVKIVPHGDLLIASDRDADGPTGSEWVAGLHPPSVTLVKLTVRRDVRRALDVCTGNGIQALLASRHAETVVATDINPRALEIAGLNCSLNGNSNVELRQGSYFEPAGSERFDLITCNPPYVISPESTYVYRDSGLPGDTVSRLAVQEASMALAEGGFAHILISWAHPPGDPWSTLKPWVDGRGCDSWLLYFGSDDPVTHAAAWLKPAARDTPESFSEALDRWLDYLDRLGIEAIAHGAVILRRRSAGANWTRTDQISLDRLEQASDHILRVFETETYLQATDDRSLLQARLVLVPKHHLEQTLTLLAGKDELQSTVLALDEGLAFRVALDDQTTRLVAGLDGRRTLAEALNRQRIDLNLTADEAERFQAEALQIVRRLIQLGLLERAHQHTDA
jgi:methylase of polypeptide subunit release factors